MVHFCTAYWCIFGLRLTIRVALINQNLEDFKNVLVSLFNSIAHNNYRNNNIEHFEGYYASVVYSYLAGCGL